MPKRLTDDDPSNTQPPKKRFTQSLSADHDSEGARLTPTTELPTLPHQAAATFSDFTPMNDATPGLTEDTARRTSTPCAPTNVVEPQRRPECFRISGIPSDWSIDNLKKQLQVIDPNLSFSDVDLSGPFPSCCDSTQTALLNFDNCTAYFQKLERNDEKLIVIREDTPDRKVRLTIDKHFYDLTPMNNPEAPITADVIAVTGLAGHAFGSWRSRASTKRPIDRPMWLRDFLPQNFPNIRIMTYGYDSCLHKANGSNLTDYRRNFTACIQNARRHCSKRPIIFIGHSLGGILIVQTLVESSLYPAEYGLHNYIRAIFLFGTPHQGLRTTELWEMVDEDSDYSAKVKDLLAQLREGSEFLENQKQALGRVLGDFRGRVCTFYETELSKSVKKIGPEVFAREGCDTQMVKRLSAQLAFPIERPYPVHSNHSDMVKFDSSRNTAFQTVITNIKYCLTNFREDLVQSLAYSGAGFRGYYVDQTAYLDNLLKTDNLEHSPGLMWVFGSPEYENWIQQKQRLALLVCGGSQVVERAAQHIVKKLESTHLVLHFFYNSAIAAKPNSTSRNSKCDWGDLSCVWTLLMQVIDGYPPPQQQYLLRIFFARALDYIEYDEQVKILSNKPEEVFERLLGVSLQLDLWDALIHVLQMLLELPKWRDLETPWKERNIALILALDHMPDEDFASLFAVIRPTVYHLGQIFAAVNVLVTYPPKMGARIQLDGFGVLLEYDTERQECLQTLRFHNEQYDIISTHHDYTFQWLWDAPEYNAWNLDEHSGMLFIEGKPGSGKSTLARYLRMFFFSRHHTAGKINPAKSITAGFFYSRRDGDPEMSHYNMLRTLLYDILLADESFFIHFQKEFRYGGGSNIVWKNDTLKSILLACGKHPLRTSIFLIVDAMDEPNEEDRRDVIQLLQALSTPTTINTECVVKVVLTSRPINELHHDLMDTRNRIVLQDRNRADIEKYTDTFLGDRVFCRAQRFKEEAKNYIVENSDGVFLWVSLIREDLVRFVNHGRNINKLMAFLKGLPKGLESYYIRMLQVLLTGNEDDINDGKRILQFCLYSHRTIELIELDHAFGIPGDNTDSEPEISLSSWEDERPTDIQKLVTQCIGNFVEIRSRPTLGLEDSESYAVIQIMHQTVRQFFLRPHDAVVRSTFHAVANAQGSQMMIRLTCVRYLKLHYNEVVLKFRESEDNYTYQNACKFVQYLNLRPFIKYSLEFLQLANEDMDPYATQPLSDLMNSIRKSPPLPALCLLRRPADRKADSCKIQQQLNHFLLIASEKGYCFAVGNLLAAAASCESIEKSGPGWTPLHLAANNGHEATVRQLLDFGADIKAKDNAHQTPLHLAASKCHNATIQQLLKRGADIEAKDDSYRTPLILAVSNKHKTTVRLLLRLGADIDAESIFRQTALSLAASKGQEFTVRLLLRLGAKIEAKDTFGRTPLYLAAMKGQNATIKLLLDHGANIEAQDDYFRTPLFWPTLEQRISTIQLLLDYGADTDARGGVYRDPLWKSATIGHRPTIQLLLSRGRPGAGPH